MTKTNKQLCLDVNVLYGAIVTLKPGKLSETTGTYPESDTQRQTLDYGNKEENEYWRHRRKQLYWLKIPKKNEKNLKV